MRASLWGAVRARISECVCTNVRALIAFEFCLCARIEIVCACFRVSVALNICLVCLSVPGFVRAWLFVFSCLCWRVVCVRVYVCVYDSVCVHVLACACACVHVVRFVCVRENRR